MPHLLRFERFVSFVAVLATLLAVVIALYIFLIVVSSRGKMNDSVNFSANAESKDLTEKVVEENL